MLDTKNLSFKDVVSMERTIRGYGPLFSARLGFPVTFEMGRRKEFLDVYMYYFGIQPARARLLSDILYPRGIIWCNIIVDHSRSSAKMMNMVTGWGYRKRGLQRMFQSVIYTTLQIGAVRFMDTYPDGRKYIARTGLFRDVQQGPLIKKYPDVQCAVDLQGCWERIAMFLKKKD